MKNKRKPLEYTFKDLRDYQPICPNCQTKISKIDQFYLSSGFRRVRSDIVNCCPECHAILGAGHAFGIRV